MSYRERIWGPDTLHAAPKKCSVVVVGGGPGGLEAARTCALRGHDVTLIEANSYLGGAFELWTRLPGREAYRSAIDWWTREVQRLKVNLQLNTRATAESVLRRKPDAVILATGAIYSRGGRGFYSELEIPGADRDFVFRPEEVFASATLPRGKVLVLDDEGLQTGLGLAELLAANGADVEFLTPNFLPVSSRLMAAQEGRPMVQRFRTAGGRISTMSYITEIGDHTVVVEDVHARESRMIANVDAVILTTSRVPVNDLEAGLDGRVAQLFIIGDALAPRVWGASTFEGHKFARLVGEPDAPRSIADAYFSYDDPALMPLPADVPRKQMS